MDKSRVVILIGKTYTVDGIGQRIATKTYKKVYCNITSVSGSEWYDGAQNGINARYRVSMFRHDYSGEDSVNIGGTITAGALSGGKDYGVYRTYEGKGDDIELYLESKTAI